MSIGRNSGSSSASTTIPNLGWKTAVISDRNGTRTVDISNTVNITIGCSTNNVQSDSCTVVFYV